MARPISRTPARFGEIAVQGHHRFRRLGGLGSFRQNLLFRVRRAAAWSLILLRFPKLVRFHKMVVGALSVPAACRIAVDVACPFRGLL
jgi:hypothetical protein